MIKSTLRPAPAQLQNPESFQLELQNRFECLASDLDDYNDGFVEAVHTVGSKFFKTRRTRTKKLSDSTLKLMEVRREMILQSSGDVCRYRQLNRRISKSLKRDIRRFNTNSIEEAIKRNRGSKVFARDLSIGQSQLTKLKTDDGRIISSKPELLGEVEKFYGQLYTTTRAPVVDLARDPRARLTRHYTEDIPDVRKTPQAWNRSVVVLFFKKGDNTLLKNYRPISLLSHVYKLFSRVITNRLARRFDDFQPPEQAGFRKGYSTVDHIHALRQVIQKTEEYNLPLCLAFVDYEKAFDSIETWAVLQSLQRCQIDYRYIEVLKC
ncbi:uncharacterized protein LOC134751210, partial [Cydia strobilella]|uniref:uncharacterized protein LOC134751210 n=1 Tax=Cydia strobilella TaxID=1100964 RepID=UPI003007295C